MKSNVGQVIANQVQSTHTLNSWVKLYILLKKKPDVTLLPFQQSTVHSLYFRTTDVTGSIEPEAGTEIVMPGDNVTIDAEFHPIVQAEQGYLLIREGGRTR